MVSEVPFIKDGYEEPDCSYNMVPCWSLAALLEVLPSFEEINPFVGHVGVKDYRCVYLYEDYGSDAQTKADNPIDACYEMIIKLHGLKML